MDPLHPTSRLQGTNPEALEREVRTLRLTVQIMLVSLVILSGSLGVYLFRQVTLLRRQVAVSSRMAQQMAQHFNINVATQGMVFERQLLDYARTNPAFKDRIAKFYASTSTPPARFSPTSGGTPAPTPPSP